MRGKNCVAIASDLRIGQQGLLLAYNFDKVFRMTDRTYVGLPGLATDVTTLFEKFRYRLNMYRMKEDREIEPETFARLVSSTLYERRFGPYFIEPVIAGLNSKNEPFIAASDLIGCLNFAKDFVVSGTASEHLFGMAEGLWEPDLEPEELFETISQTMLNGLERDTLSGMGVVVRVLYVHTPLRCDADRQDARKGDSAHAQVPHGLAYAQHVCSAKRYLRFGKRPRKGRCRPAEASRLGRGGRGNVPVGRGAAVREGVILGVVMGMAVGVVVDMTVGVVVGMTVGVVVGVTVGVIVGMAAVVAMVMVMVIVIVIMGRDTDMAVVMLVIMVAVFVAMSMSMAVPVVVAMSMMVIAVPMPVVVLNLVAFTEHLDR